MASDERLKHPQPAASAPLAEDTGKVTPLPGRAENEDRLPTGAWDSEYQPLVRALLGSGHASRHDLLRASTLIKQTGLRMPRALLNLGLLAEEELARQLSHAYDAPLVDLDEVPDLPPAAELLPLRFMQQYCVVPVEQTEDTLRLVVADPSDPMTRHMVELATKLPVELAVAPYSRIEAALENSKSRQKSAEIPDTADPGDSEIELSQSDVEQLRDLASEAPVIRLVNQLIEQAVKTRASDIHIEPFDGRLRVRYRTDGVLEDTPTPSVATPAAVISRVKLMAKLDIAERRLPQDGRIRLRVEGQEIDMRISTLPTMHGEDVVIRLFNREQAELDLEALGFEDSTLRGLLDALQKPYGILLVTGPTGSGKTTTMYAALQILRSAERKIVTVEDPVEYQLDGINQVQVQSQIGLSFAASLRSILRHDPDVILIGEMRDRETAQIAIQAALTGHLVLSTLHTNNAASGATRLLDMGIEDYLLTSTVHGILAQRLIRTLCADCRQRDGPVSLLQDAPDAGDAPLASAYRPGGCHKCRGSGYRGRTSVGEFLPMTDSIRRLVMERADSSRIEKQAVEEGMLTLYQEGISKVRAGLTTTEEVLRVTQDY